MTVSSAGVAAFPRKPLPKRFCNLDRLLQALKARGLDGIVATVPNNVFYLTGFNAIAHKSDEPRVCAVTCRYFCFWPTSDLPARPLFRRCWERTGHQRARCAMLTPGAADEFVMTSLPQICRTNCRKKAVSESHPIVVIQRKGRSACFRRRTVM